MRAGRLELLTQDHSLANEVLELRPDLPEADAARLPRNVITRALGMSEALRVTVRTLDLSPLDRFVLCSDGLTDVLSDDVIAEVLSTTVKASETAKALIARALAAPAYDNDPYGNALQATAPTIDFGYAGLMRFVIGVPRSWSFKARTGPPE
jgi:protein phosphatase